MLKNMVQGVAWATLCGNGYKGKEMASRHDPTNIKPGSDPTQNVARIYEGRNATGTPRNAEPRRRRDRLWTITLHDRVESILGAAMRCLTRTPISIRPTGTTKTITTIAEVGFVAAVTVSRKCTAKAASTNLFMTRRTSGEATNCVIRSKTTAMRTITGITPSSSITTMPA